MGYLFKLHWKIIYNWLVESVLDFNSSLNCGLDTCTILLQHHSGEGPDMFLRKLYFQIPNINFTTETEKDNKIPILDIQVTRNKDSQTLYRKLTYTGQYINVESVPITYAM